MAFFEGCPGGVPTGAGLVDGGVDQGAGLVDGGSGRRGKGSGGGARASVPGGPRDGANFATCVVFLSSPSFPTRTKRRKMFFLKDALWGGRGYPPELAWWTGG